MSDILVVDHADVLNGERHKKKKELPQGVFFHKSNYVVCYSFVDYFVHHDCSNDVI
jgi:hypothetical protein